MKSWRPCESPDERALPYFVHPGPNSGHATDEVPLPALLLRRACNSPLLLRLPSTPQSVPSSCAASGRAGAAAHRLLRQVGHASSMIPRSNAAAGPPSYSRPAGGLFR